jgi:hypothetical protein
MQLVHVALPVGVDLFEQSDITIYVWLSQVLWFRQVTSSKKSPNISHKIYLKRDEILLN